MILWYPRAVRAPRPDAGPFVAGPYRGVLHTTEGSTYAGARAAYVANNSAPHFTASFEAGRFEVWQHIALDRAARALKNKPGGVETNRLSAIQIEVVAKAADPAWPASLVAGVRELMAWIEAQTGIKPLAPKFLPYPTSYGSSTVRFYGGLWRNFAGWCGHQHVPENDHGDPGAIPIDQLLVRGVKPMFDPARVYEPVVADLDCPTGGAWSVAASGAVYTHGSAPYHGGANGKDYFVGRKAARLELSNNPQYVYEIVATSSEKYGFPE